MKQEIEIFKKGREYLLKEVLKGLALDQINEIPNGFTGNIGWHLGHLMTTHRGLVYQLGGHRSGLEKEIILRFARGSKPEQAMTQEEYDFIKKKLRDQIDEFEYDFDQGLFNTEYREFTTMTGYTIHNMEEAIAFSNFHQATHLGYIMALKRLV